MKLFYAAVLALVAAPIATAQKNISGVMRLEFGYITLPNGQRVSAKGLMVPWTARPAVKRQKRSKWYNPGPHTDAIIAYSNVDNFNNPPQYNGIGTDCPSSLDDLQVQNDALNKPFQLARFAVDTSSGDRVLMRWRWYRTYTGGLGPGVSAFSNEIDDFGGYWDPASAGLWDVTFNWGAVYGFSVPDSLVYMAMQFREPAPFPWLENGEGFFRTDYKPGFYGLGVQVGSSLDQFFLDSDMNGIYDEQEVDQFDPPGVPNLANIACYFDTNGTITEVLPQTSAVIHGLENEGNIFDTWGSDDTYYGLVSNPKLLDNPTPVAVRIESTVTGTVGTITSMRFVLESNASSAMVQKIYLRNFTTSQWVPLSTTTLSPTDQLASALVPNGTNPTQFVQAGTKKVWTLIVLSEPSPFEPGPYAFKIDKCNWVITRP